MEYEEKTNRLDELGRRLQTARDQAARNNPKESAKPATPPSVMGAAFRIGIELVIASGVGAWIGTLVDDALGSHPWGFIVFFFLGSAAGLRNVFRTSQKMQAAHIAAGPALEPPAPKPVAAAAPAPAPKAPGSIDRLDNPEPQFGQVR